MNAHKFVCSHCEQHLQCDEEFAGREVQCPACHHLIRIPPIPGQTAQYKPESGKTWATFVPPGDVPAPRNLSLRKENPPKSSDQK